jgi:hypothetical protein
MGLTMNSIALLPSRSAALSSCHTKPEQSAGRNMPVIQEASVGVTARLILAAAEFITWA